MLSRIRVSVPALRSGAVPIDATLLRAKYFRPGFKTQAVAVDREAS